MSARAAACKPQPYQPHTLTPTVALFAPRAGARPDVPDGRPSGRSGMDGPYMARRCILPSHARQRRGRRRRRPCSDPVLAPGAAWVWLPSSPACRSSTPTQLPTLGASAWAASHAAGANCKRFRIYSSSTAVRTCNFYVEPSAHTSTHNRSSEAPRKLQNQSIPELVEITTAWKYSFMPVK